jgi:hypothetical protein
MKRDLTKQDLQEIGNAITTLVAEKNNAYGNSIETSGKIMEILYPNGVYPSQYDDALLIVRIVDKLTRIARGDKAAFSESPYIDIAGYGLRGVYKDGGVNGSGQAKEGVANDTGVDWR